MIAQQLVNGLFAGGVYALFSLGLTLVFGIHKILNLAHGAVFMWGAFIGVFCVEAGMPLWIAFVVAAVAAGLLSVATELVAFRRLRKQGEVEFGPIVSSLGVSLVLGSLAQYASQTSVMRFPFGTVSVESFNVGGVKVTLLQTVIATAAVLLIGLLTYFIYRTNAGRKIRAVAANERAAALCGANPSGTFFQTFFIAGALAGAAGVLVGLSFNSVHFMMGDSFMLRGFAVIVLGGLGSIPGALAAGMLLGIVQTVTVAYISSGFSDIVVFVLLFVVLVVRPNGLFNLASANLMAVRR